MITDLIPEVPGERRPLKLLGAAGGRKLYDYRYTFNGFAAPFDARALAIVVKNPDVRGVYAVRAAIPLIREKLSS